MLGHQSSLNLAAWTRGGRQRMVLPVVGDCRMNDLSSPYQPRLHHFTSLRISEKFSSFDRAELSKKFSERDDSLFGYQEC